MLAGFEEAGLSEAEKHRIHDRVKNLIGDSRQSAARTGPTLKICFLEDSCTSSHAIREMLADYGHDVDHFSTAEEAYDAVMEVDYDLLLASQIVAQGGMGCESLISRIRSAREARKRDLPILAITADPDASNVKGLARAGADRVVVKPLEGAKLNAIVTRTAGKAALQEKQRRTTRSLRICFLEDSCTSSQAIREMLGERGHQVDHFSAVEEVLDAVKEVDYDLLLASQTVALGSMDCKELIRRLRQSSRGDLAIVAIASDTAEDTIATLKACGADDVIVKPVESDQLDRCLEETAARRTGTQQPAVQKTQTLSPAAPQPADSVPLARTLRICFLEDSCTSSQAIREMLAGRGHEIDHFSSAEETLDAVFEKSYDLLLASQIVALGGMDCESLISTLRNSEREDIRRLPVVAITADGAADNIRRLRAAGADDVVVKPFEQDLSDALLAVVKGGSRARTPRRPRSELHLKICFLEDSCTSSQAIREVLGSYGHEVDHFSAAEEALDAVMEKEYDLLLASQIEAAGGLDCAGMVHSIRCSGNPLKSQLPIVVLTANPDPANIQAFISTGANKVIVKPVEGDLNEQLVDAMRNKSSRPTLRVVRGNNGQPQPPNTGQHQTNQPQSGTPGGTGYGQPPGYGGQQQPAPPQPPLTPQAPPPQHGYTGTTPPPPPPQTPPHGQDPLMDMFGPAPSLDFGPDGSGYGDPQMPPPDMMGAQMEMPHPQAAPVGPQRSKRGLLYLLGLAAVVAVVATAWHHFGERVEVEVVSVRQGGLARTIHAPGRVVSKKQVDVTTAVPGQIVKVYVSEGDKVRKGEVLAKMDDRQARLNLQRAEAEVKSAQREVQLAERSLERLVRALQTGAVSRQMAEDAEAAVNATKAKEQLAREELRSARLQLERLEIKAPFSGVVSQSYAVEGLWAEPPGALFTIVDLKQRQIALRVPAEDADDIVVGQAVQLTSDAFPAHEWREKVLHVMPSSGSGNMVTVQVSLGKEAPPLRYGQTVDAQILTASNSNALKLPFEAVITRNGRPMVAVVEDEQVRYKTVELGIEAMTEVEVLSGLEPGDIVILPRGDLEEGQRVVYEAIPDYIREDEGFPLREKYKDVAIYTTEKLRKNYNDVYIVDVRSQFEYDVVHIAKAVNVPIASDRFLRDLAKIRSKDGTTPIVFYCNGHTCSKSYKASKKAMRAGFKHIYAYDAGIRDWMYANPSRTTLLDKTPAPREKMVSEDYYRSRLLSWESFKRKAKNNDAIIIDVRDDIQKSTTIQMETVDLPLDRFINKLNAGQFKDKQLLIFDAVGKQVRWLQYILEDRGYKDYFFLRKGIKGIEG